MKKLTILFSIMLFGLIGLSQNDTIEIGDTIEIIKDSIIYESGFQSLDTIYFEPYNPNQWYYSEWFENTNLDTIVRVQLRISDEGVQEQRVLKYMRSTKTKVKHDYYSKLKEKKDKKEKDK